MPLSPPANTCFYTRHFKVEATVAQWVVWVVWVVTIESVHLTLCLGGFIWGFSVFII